MSSVQAIKDTLNSINFDNLNHDELVSIKDKLFNVYLKCKANTFNNTSLEDYMIFPITDQGMYNFMVESESTHWSDHEYNFMEDRDSFDKLSNELKDMINKVIAFFLVGDGGISQVINEKYRFLCKTFESELFFISQEHIEAVHAMVYNTAAVTFNRGVQEMSKLINLVSTNKCIIAKMNFLRRAVYEDLEDWQRYIITACVEGIFFCSLFNIIFWFRSINSLKIFVDANEMISRDESLHRNTHLYLLIKCATKYIESSNNKNEAIEFVKSFIYDTVKMAVEIEDMFTDELLPEPIQNLNGNKCKNYTRVITDNLLSHLSVLGIDTIYNVKCECEWVTEINLPQKSNFFERQVSSYNKGSINDRKDWKKLVGITNEGVEVETYDPTVDTDTDF